MHKPTHSGTSTRGPSLTVGGGVKDWSPVESGAGTIAPSRPFPHVQHHSAATSVTPPRGTPKAPPLKVTDAPRQKKKKKKAQMTEHFKAPEKIQLSKEELAISSLLSCIFSGALKCSVIWAILFFFVLVCLLLKGAEP